MPWKGVTVSEERRRFREDYRLKYYTVSELAERFSVSRWTARKWIDRFEQAGESGFHELSRRPHRSPGQTDPVIVQELAELRTAHPHWGPAKLLDLMRRRRPRARLPSLSTAARILARQGLVRPRRRYRRAHPGCPKSIPQGPNDIWAADYKGQFRLKNGAYCFPLTVSDLGQILLHSPRVVHASESFLLEATPPLPFPLRYFYRDKWIQIRFVAAVKNNPIVAAVSTHVALTRPPANRSEASAALTSASR